LSRRSTPERIDAAHRAGIRSRLIGEGMLPKRVDDWIAQWEAQAARLGLERGSEYREAGYRWIASQRQSRRA
jgi:hypothetical protein